MAKKILLDLGGGDRPTKIEGYETHNIDLHPSGGDQNVVFDLFEDGLPATYVGVDMVVANDLLEHVPTLTYKLHYDPYEESYEMKPSYPRIVLLNAIWDVLRYGGLFISKTPSPNNTGDLAIDYAWAQDPTHVDVPWTSVSFDYFSNNPAYERLQVLYGIKARFKIKRRELIGSHLHVTLEK